MLQKQALNDLWYQHLWQLLNFHFADITFLSFPHFLQAKKEVFRETNAAQFWQTKKHYQHMLSTRVKSLQFSFLFPAASWNVLHAIRIYFAISLFMPDLWVIKYLDVERNFIENLTWSEFNEHNGLQGVSGRLNMNFILFVPLLGVSLDLPRKHL